jgi:ribosomal protein S18 acetylase RimI-like enzyme
MQGKYFTIQKIDESYVDEVFEVYRLCEDFLSLGPVPYASRQMVLDDFELSKDMGGIFCGIFVEGDMVGIVDFVLKNYDDNPENAYLSLLMISKPYRRRGIGREIVRTIEEEILKNKSIKAILAGVQTNNAPGIAFWTSMGYKIASSARLLPDTTIAYDLRKDVK